MVTACRAYITDNGSTRIWDQDTQEIIQKIEVPLLTEFWQLQFNLIWLYLSFQPLWSSDIALSVFDFQTV